MPREPLWLSAVRQDMTRRVLTRCLAWLGPVLLRAWFSTIRLRWYGGSYLDPDPRTRGNVIFVFWHQRLLCFTYTHAKRGGRVLISQSRDGEIIARLIGSLGFVPIRGSSHRGKRGRACAPG